MFCYGKVDHITDIVMGSFFIKLSILVNNVKSRLESESIKGLNRGQFSFNDIKRTL